MHAGMEVIQFTTVGKFFEGAQARHVSDIKQASVCDPDPQDTGEQTSTHAWPTEQGG